MKKYTQEDFNNFEKNEYGYIIFPSGDYTLIKSFPDKCRFGDFASFGHRASFGDFASFGDCTRFGNYARFGESASFGHRASFGESARFGNSALYCLFEFNKLINLNGLYKYPIRIYLNTEKSEYFLSIGCENIATLDGCKTISKERGEDNNNIINIVENIINEVLK